MKKIISLICMICLLSIGLLGCAADSDKVNAAKNSDGNAGGQEKSGETVDVSFQYNEKDYRIAFDEAPKRAAALSQFMTEMLLALGLQDHIVCTAWIDNEILPEFKEAYDKIPAFTQYPSKEQLMSYKPDFVTGYPSLLSEKNLGPIEDMMAKNYHPFIPKSAYSEATINTVYEDILTIGKIFRVEDRAEQLVTDMREEERAIARILEKVEEPVKVLGYDSGEKEPFVVGKGIAAELIEKAGGTSIFADLDKAFATVSWEQIVERNPDVIVIVDYGLEQGGETYESKLKFLKENNMLKNVNAIKNDRFIRVGLADITPGIRNVEAIKTLAAGLYPEKFKNE